MFPEIPPYDWRRFLPELASLSPRVREAIELSSEFAWYLIRAQIPAKGRKEEHINYVRLAQEGKPHLYRTVEAWKALSRTERAEAVAFLTTGYPEDRPRNESNAELFRASGQLFAERVIKVFHAAASAEISRRNADLRALFPLDVPLPDTDRGIIARLGYVLAYSKQSSEQNRAFWDEAQEWEGPVAQAVGSTAAQLFILALNMERFEARSAKRTVNRALDALA